MDSREIGRILKGLVRVGTVSAVDEKRAMVRVKFKSEDMTSGWLYVLQHQRAQVHIEPDGGHTHRISDSYTGGGSARAVADHSHNGSYLEAWLPRVNEKVLCLYLPVFNGDGFVLGGIV